MNVLIVDDNADLQFYELSAQKPDVVRVLNSGLEALDYLAQHSEKVDAVLLDLSMPTLDGLALAEEIRRNELVFPHKKKLRLAFFTACEVDEVVENVCQTSNIEKVFPKPIAADDLLKQVKDWIGQEK